MNDVLRFGPVAVHLGEKSGKYPDGNQVIVQGADQRVAFDTPLVANRIGPDFDDVDLVILGHVHEDHMTGLHRVPHAAVQVHHADLAAAQSWDGLSRHFGYPPAVLAVLQAGETGENPPHILGLHVVEQILAAHGGTVAFAQALPHGAAAALTLPL